MLHHGGTATSTDCPRERSDDGENRVLLRPVEIASGAVLARSVVDYLPHQNGKVVEKPLSVFHLGQQLNATAVHTCCYYNNYGVPTQSYFNDLNLALR